MIHGGIESKAEIRGGFRRYGSAEASAESTGRTDRRPRSPGFLLAAILAGCGGETGESPALPPPTAPSPARAEPASAVSHSPAWIAVRGVEDLRSQLAQAKREGKPAVVFVSAAWCAYCQVTDRTMEEAPEVRARLADVVRIRIDVTDDPRADLRDALGLPRSQPYLVFVDDQGEIRRELDLSGRPDGAALLARLDRLGAR